MKILSISRRHTEKARSTLHPKWEPNKWVITNIVIRADTEQECNDLDYLCLDVIKKQLVKDYDAYMINVLSRVTNRCKGIDVSSDYLLGDDYITGFELVAPILNKAKVKGIYYFHHYIWDSPATQGILTELEFMRVTSTGYPGTRETMECRLVALLQALDLFWD